MEIGIITLFPEMFDALKLGITGRAIANKLITLSTINPRDFTTDKHHTVDDRPYGGGPGMLMKVEPLEKAIKQAKANLTPQAKVIYVSPQGKRFNQSMAGQAATENQLIFVAGRYEGIDERLLDTLVDEEWSIGDYILSGGELAIMVIVDTIARLLPGALGDEASIEQESFSEGLLEYPHYTRPEIINGLAVPSVLLSGDHQAIATWRLKQALGKTWLRRPDLLQTLQLDALQTRLLNEFIKDYEEKLRKQL
ncbi:MAG: tRNA (guanosine(37)-N1)-methyltransferase TrmD [Gammaproteobacteria bacterium GWE2_42_36]|nr:MAG: tRNA (guanosine(37)-N1)-methyltransferase TrmD [Gammaproteobacteria bacterium GWE2_42_36]HCU05487.1 tRNA (guanosine(37)-N1)-methyltransferase TrmD [Coxiellaceae bacterium]